MCLIGALLVVFSRLHFRNNLEVARIPVHSPALDQIRHMQKVFFEQAGNNGAHALLSSLVSKFPKPFISGESWSYLQCRTLTRMPLRFAACRIPQS
jgi:hypothetical protein